VLARGYAIVTDAHGRALVDSARVRAGDRIDLRLHAGRLVAEIIDSRAADDRESDP
jgi:exodeoxyribonuclease VII large subunit